METQSPNTIVRNLEDRINELKKVLSKPNESKRKERRQYSTRLFVSPSMSSAFWFLDISAGHIPLDCGGGQSVQDSFLTLLSRPIYSDEGVLFPKPSMKSKPAEEVRDVIFDAAKRAMGLLESEGRMGSLGDLFAQQRRSDEFYTATSGLLKDTCWCSDLLSVLSESVLDPCKVSRYLEAWPRPQAASLHSSMNPQRGETRAFVSDRDLLRSLLGSTLHTLLHPPDPVERNEYRPYSSSMPRDKHYLNYHRIAVPAGYALALLFGDISSFTSSFKNIWAVLIYFTMLLESEGNDRHLVISIKGRMIETSLVEVLKLFIYLGSLVSVIDQDESFVSCGAMLGIAGVDTIAKVLFSLYLETACRNLPKVRASCRVGGDDFLVFVLYKLGYSEDLVWATACIRANVNEFVGHLKVLEVETLEYGADMILDSLYCKKEVRARSSEKDITGGYYFEFMSQWPMPLLGDFFDKPGDWNDEKTLGFVHALKGVPYVPEREYLQRIYFEAASARHNLSIPGERTHKIYEALPESQRDGYTDKARDMIEKVDSIQDSNGNSYRMTFEHKAMIIQHRLMRIEVWNGVWNEKVYTLRGEATTTEVMKGTPKIPHGISGQDVHVGTLMRLADELGEASTNFQL